MSPFTSFKIITSVDLHFGSMKYSMLKYGISTKHICSRWADMTQGQKYRYEWISERFNSNQDVLYAGIACSFKEISAQFAPKEEVLEAQLKFKGRRESMTHILKRDRSKMSLRENIDGKKIFFAYLGGEISPEYVIIYDQANPFLELMYEDRSMIWAAPKILKLIKYRDFFNYGKYAQILNDVQEAA